MRMSPHYAQSVGGVGGEEDPLQGPRPPERSFVRRAKRLSCRLSEGASVLWGGWGGQEDDTPPPVPRHRTDPSKYDVVVSDRNHVRLLDEDEVLHLQGAPLHCLRPLPPHLHPRHSLQLSSHPPRRGQGEHHRRSQI